MAKTTSELRSTYPPDEEEASHQYDRQNRGLLAGQILTAGFNSHTIRIQNGVYFDATSRKKIAPPYPYVLRSKFKTANY